MIFERISLYNFGIYQGHHTISLDSPEHNKPIILIGALNGAGKTTFLDALQLALYGKFAKCSNRGKLGYLSYLEKNINTFSVDRSASITLRFRHGDDNKKPQVYEVKRFWKKEPNRECKEFISVSFNGEHDQLLSENWEDFVNEFIPQSISELFFFDGEKIENLADPKRAAELLKNGIEALLGLELLSSLSTDLNELKKRKQEKLLPQEDTEELDLLKKELNSLKNSRRDVVSILEKIEEKLNEEQDELVLIQEKLKSNGADKLSLKTSLDQEKAELTLRLLTIKHDLLKLASGPLPLSLTTGLLSRAKNQATIEKEYNTYKNSEDLLKKQKDLLLELLSKKINNEDLYCIKKEFDSKLNNERKNNEVYCYLNTDPIYFLGLEENIESDLKSALNLLTAYKEIQDALILTERKINTIPTFGSVKELIEKNAKQEAKLHTTLKAKEDLYARLNDITADIKNNENQQNLLLLKNNSVHFEQKRQNSIIKHIDTLRHLITSFNKNLVNDNITRLERKIKSKFDLLKRKDSLIHSIKIDPINYTMTLYASNKLELSTDRLSAGERQLLSIAILWGLAESSGKELPTIIDTPMGRLDGEHRNLLIKEYFPNAASQVILLSTDEEIYGKYYENLRPFIAKEYHIIYNNDTKSSFFSTGYIESAK
ncbi:DNA sulfur modification protein DndD [Klebsiella michiganensis]